MTATEERKDALRAVADAHDVWVAGNLDAPFEPDGFADGSDYNQHYVDVDAAGPAQDAYAQQVAVLAGPVTTAAAARTDENLREYWIHGEGALKIRWGTPGAFKRCVSQLNDYSDGGTAFDPEGLCAEMYHEATGRWPGSKKDHTSLDTDLMDIDVVTAEPCLPCMLEPLPGEMWHAVAHTEGVSTGQRVWLPGSITWREPPFAFHWEIESSAHGGTARIVHVGNVTRVMKIDGKVHAWGDLDLGDRWGGEAARKIAQGHLNGVSMGPGSERIGYDQVWPSGMTAEQRATAEPEQWVFSDYRMGELTSVSVPAQEGAFLEATPELLALMGVGSPRREQEIIMVASAGAMHRPGLNCCRTPNNAEPCQGWNAKVAAPTRKPRSELRRLRLPDLRAMAAEIGVKSSPRATKAQLINDLVAGTVAHKPMTASASGGSWTITVAELPSEDMFVKDFPAGTPPTLTEDGRFFGYFAPGNTAHRAFARAGVRKTAKQLGKTDYSRWLRRMPVAEGHTVLAGPITMECMHAPLQGYGTLERRHQAYEDTCSIVARAAVGEDNDGARWFSGTIMPGVTSEQIEKLLMCQLSLDCQPHPDRPGWQDFVGVLAVPLPGWPVAVTASAAGEDELEGDGPAVAVSRVLEDDDFVFITASSSPPIVFAAPQVYLSEQAMYAIAGVDPAQIVRDNAVSFEAALRGDMS